MPPFALPRGTFSDAGGYSAACVAPTYPPGAHRSHISFLLASPKKISSFPEAGVMTCVSAKASLSTFPDLQMREAKGQSITIGQDMIEKQKLLLWCLGGCLFWIERERERWRERFMHTPPLPRKVMVGDKKSELLDISPFTSKGNPSLAGFSGKGRPDYWKVWSW